MTPSASGPMDALKNLNPRDLGSRLQAARKARGLTQAEVASHLGVARTTVTAIEAGEREVRPAELARMARLYARSIAELVERQEPVEPFSVQFRSTIPVDDLPGGALEQAIFDFQRLCEDYVALEQLSEAPLATRYPPPYEIDQERPERSAEDIANRERQRLGLGDAPILNLRGLLEGDVGIRVFSMDLPSRVAAMFAYGSEFGGCIAVNRNHPAERRRHSLAHDYGHFLTDRYRPAIAVLGRYRRVPAHERFAEAFGRAFLLPSTGLVRRFTDLKQARAGSVTAADLCVFAHLFFVSVEAMTRRLEELDLVPVGTWDRLGGQNFRVREAQSILGLPPQPETGHALPVRYRYLAVQGFLEGRLSEGQLARFLRTDRVGARRIVEGLATHVGLSEGGEVERESFDLSTAI